MTNFLIPITVNVLPAISELEGRQGMFILPDGSININRQDGTWMIINKQSDHAGVLKTTDTVSVQPGVAKWYWAGPGTYANAGGKVIQQYGIISYTGSSWQSLEIELPQGSSALPVFDPADNTNPATMQATADRYDAAITALEGFFTADGAEYLAYNKTLENFSINGVTPIVRTDKSIVVPKSDGTLNDVPGAFTTNSTAMTWINVPTISGNKKITRLYRIGRIVGGNTTNMQCVMVGFKGDGTSEALILGVLPPTPSYHTDDIDLTPYTHFTLLMFAVDPSDPPQTLKIYEKLATASVTNIKNYIDNINNINESSNDERITIEGQSNAVGYANRDDLIANYPGLDWSKEFSRVFIWNPSTNQYENLKIGKNTFGIGSDIGQFPIVNSSPSDKYFGIEIPLALIWMETHKHGCLYIDKNTGNGQAISYFQKGSAFYTEKLTRLTKANKWLSDRGISVNDSSYVWIQGEADANSDTYLVDLQKLISDRKNDKNIRENTRIGIAQVNNSNAAYSAAVANAKTQYVANNLKSFLLTYPNNLRPDNLHLTTAGIITMGLLFAAKCFKTDAYSYTDLAPKSNWVI